MIHISLFSGIGGFELAAEWMGWRNWVSCDINDFGNKVREFYWPDGYCHKDVKTLTYETINKELSVRFGSGWRDDDIIITGGFPCQPYSSAGKRLGKEDERHLWPEMLRVISEVKPTYIVGENVRGLTNWNGGVVFEEVCADLENLGYEVQPVLLPACAVGAPHRRDRIWFVANRIDAADTECEGLQGSNDTRGTNFIDRENSKIWRNSFGYNQENYRDAADTNSRRLEGTTEVGWHSFNVKRKSQFRPTADTDSDGQHQCDSQHKIDPSQGGQHAFNDIEPIYNAKSSFKHTMFIGQKWRLYKEQSEDAIQQQFNKRNARSFKPTNWQNFPTQSPICGGDDGLPTQLDGITFSKWRNESIKAYGNAIVPQVAYQIFKAICPSKFNSETFNSDSPTTDSSTTSPSPLNSGWNSLNEQ